MVLVYDHLNDCACVLYRFIVKRNSSWLDNILPNSVHVFLYDDELQLTEDLVNITNFLFLKRVFARIGSPRNVNFPSSRTLFIVGLWGGVLENSETKIIISFEFFLIFISYENRGRWGQNVFVSGRLRFFKGLISRHFFPPILFVLFEWESSDQGKYSNFNKLWNYQHWIVQYRFWSLSIN